MFYCEGRVCKRRDECILHNPEVITGNPIQYLDQSVIGSGCIDSNGKSCVTWNCGDNGNYSLFKQVNERCKRTDNKEENK